MRKVKTKPDTYLISSEDEYFDDCPVCQTMKDVEHGKVITEQDLKKAFQKAKKKGGVGDFAGEEDDIL